MYITQGLKIRLIEDLPSINARVIV